MADLPNPNLPNSEQPAPRESPGSPPPLEHPSVRSEPHSVPFVPIMVTIGVLITCGALILYGVWIFFVARQDQQQAAKASRYPLAPTATMRLPPQPRLEPLNHLGGVTSSSVTAREQANEQRLNSYGAADEAGFVHIPIQVAIKMIASKLPVRAQQRTSDAYKENGLLDAGEPNSGRIYRETVYRETAP